MRKIYVSTHHGTSADQVILEMKRRILRCLAHAKKRGHLGELTQHEIRRRLNIGRTSVSRDAFNYAFGVLLDVDRAIVAIDETHIRSDIYRMTPDGASLWLKLRDMDLSNVDATK